jgi:hypothetical protein
MPNGLEDDDDDFEDDDLDLEDLANEILEEDDEDEAPTQAEET